MVRLRIDILAAARAEDLNGLYLRIFELERALASTFFTAPELFKDIRARLVGKLEELRICPNKTSFYPILSRFEKDSEPYCAAQMVMALILGEYDRHVTLRFDAMEERFLGDRDLDALLSSLSSLRKLMASHIVDNLIDRHVIPFLYAMGEDPRTNDRLQVAIQRNDTVEMRELTAHIVKEYQCRVSSLSSEALYRLTQDGAETTGEHLVLLSRMLGDRAFEKTASSLTEAMFKVLHKDRVPAPSQSL